MVVCTSPPSVAPMAAQEGDKIDGNDSPKKMHNAAAEIHGLLRCIPKQTQPSDDADNAHGGNGVHR